MKYRNLFFDLDDTIWAFSRNARDTFEEVYRKYSFERYFDSFDHYYTIYQQRNTELWIEYGEGKITKDELNRQRFSYPLQAVGVEDETLAEKFSEDFFAIIPTKSGLMPYAKEVLEYLAPKYNLYIQKKRKFPGILYIQLFSFFSRKDSFRSPLFHLPQSGESGRCHKTFDIFVGGQLLRFVKRKRTIPDDRHIAFQDIEQLR